MSFTIIERNDNPTVVRHSKMVVAVGTRRVITPDIITVEDQETTNSSRILYTVEYVATESECGTCEGEPRGRIEKTSNAALSPQFFSQAEINAGNISFQHFEVRIVMLLLLLLLLLMLMLMLLLLFVVYKAPPVNNLVLIVLLVRKTCFWPDP